MRYPKPDYEIWKEELENKKPKNPYCGLVIVWAVLVGVGVWWLTK